MTQFYITSQGALSARQIMLLAGINRREFGKRINAGVEGDDLLKPNPNKPPFDPEKPLTIGQTHGLWTVTRKVVPGTWEVTCDCGNTQLIRAYEFGRTYSCGGKVPNRQVFDLRLPKEWREAHPAEYNWLLDHCTEDGFASILMHLIAAGKPLNARQQMQLSRKAAGGKRKRRKQAKATPGPRKHVFSRQKILALKQDCDDGMAPSLAAGIHGVPEKLVSALVQKLKETEGDSIELEERVA